MSLCTVDWGYLPWRMRRPCLHHVPQQHTYAIVRVMQACEGADAAVVVVGGSMIENHKDASTGAYRPATEGEGLDRRECCLCIALYTVL
jgi:hypothetical protein